MDWSDEVRARLVREEERLRYKAANLHARDKTVMAAQELVVADDIRAALEEIERLTQDLADIVENDTGQAARAEAAEAEHNRLREENAFLREALRAISILDHHDHSNPSEAGELARAALRGGE